MGKNILPDIVGLIYLKHNQFIPFIDIYRNNIECCEVVNDKQTESARLVYKNDKFYIYFGKNFIDEYNLTLDDIVFVFIHELLHYYLKHYDLFRDTNLSPLLLNMACDMQINSYLYELNDFKSISVMDKTLLPAYDEFLQTQDLSNRVYLLAPPHKSQQEIIKDFDAITSIDNDKKQKIISLWFDNFSKHLPLDEIIKRLIEIFPDFAENQEQDQEKLKEVENKISELEKILKENNLTQNRNDDKNDTSQSINDDAKSDGNDTQDVEIIDIQQLQSYFETDDLELKGKRVKHRKLNILRNSIEKVFFYNKNYTTFSDNEAYFKTTVPFFNRQELFLVMQDCDPLFYTKTFNYKTKSKEFPAIYIDFSGSTDDYKEQIYLLLLKLSDKFTGPYFLFTSDIKEVKLDFIKKGKTISGATDITCVLEHINQNNFKRALIITDGEFEPSDIKVNCDLYVLLFEKDNSVDALKNSGKIVNLWYLN
ncbi:MAG TPA: hypothetical protein PK887_09425 [Ignavibacteriales bacterium]|nr:hypothetical protein [Ignavibacteriales bacterium]HOP50828.1 hypothetical protein [Ignavibacteriales bacterium]